jgi:limonene-1,2-epoxide hydrolase
VKRLALAGALLAALMAVSAAQAVASPEQVVRAWSHALNRNDNEHAARLFAHNAHVIQPGVDVRLNTHKIAVAFNNALPCAGQIVHLRIKGNHVTATFTLGHRPMHKCSGTGVQAAALFVIQHGKIVQWQQVPVPAQATA